PSPAVTPFPYTTLFRSGLLSSAGSPSQIRAALFAVGVPRCWSRQLTLTLSCPPTNHLAKGNFHCSTFLNGLDQTSSALACLPQRSEEHTSELQSRFDLV